MRYADLRFIAEFNFTDFCLVFRISKALRGPNFTVWDQIRNKLQNLVPAENSSLNVLNSSQKVYTENFSKYGQSLH